MYRSTFIRTPGASFFVEAPFLCRSQRGQKPGDTAHPAARNTTDPPRNTTDSPRPRKATDPPRTTPQDILPRGIGPGGATFGSGFSRFFLPYFSSHLRKSSVRERLTIISKADSGRATMRSRPPNFLTMLTMAGTEMMQLREMRKKRSGSSSSEI